MGGCRGGGGGGAEAERGGGGAAWLGADTVRAGVGGEKKKQRRRCRRRPVADVVLNPTGKGKEGMEPEDITADGDEAVDARPFCAMEHGLVVFSRGATRVGAPSDERGLQVADALVCARRFGLGMVADATTTSPGVVATKLADAEAAAQQVEAVLLDRALASDKREAITTPPSIATFTVPNEQGEFRLLALSPNDDVLLAAGVSFPSPKPLLAAFDVASQKLLWTWHADTDTRITCVRASSSKVAVVVKPSQLWWGDLRSGQLQPAPAALQEGEPATAVAWCPDRPPNDDLLAVGNAAGVVSVWSTSQAPNPDDPEFRFACEPPAVVSTQPISLLCWPLPSTLLVGYDPVQSSRADAVVSIFEFDPDSEAGPLASWFARDPLSLPPNSWRAWPHRFYASFVEPWSCFLITSSWASTLGVIGKWFEGDESGFYRWQLTRQKEPSLTPGVLPPTMWRLAERPWIPSRRQGIWEEQTFARGACLVMCSSVDVPPIVILGDNRELEGKKPAFPPPTLLVASSDGVVEFVGIVDANLDAPTRVTEENPTFEEVVVAAAPVAASPVPAPAPAPVSVSVVPAVAVAAPEKQPPAELKPVDSTPAYVPALLAAPPTLAAETLGKPPVAAPLPAPPAPPTLPSFASLPVGSSFSSSSFSFGAANPNPSAATTASVPPQQPRTSAPAPSLLFPTSSPAGLFSPAPVGAPALVFSPTPAPSSSTSAVSTSTTPAAVAAPAPAATPSETQLQELLRQRDLEIAALRERERIRHVPDFASVVARLPSAPPPASLTTTPGSTTTPARPSLASGASAYASASGAAPPTPGAELAVIARRLTGALETALQSLPPLPTASTGQTASDAYDDAFLDAALRLKDATLEQMAYARKDMRAGLARISQDLEGLRGEYFLAEWEIREAHAVMAGKGAFADTLAASSVEAIRLAGAGGSKSAELGGGPLARQTAKMRASLEHVKTRFEAVRDGLDVRERLAEMESMPGAHDEAVLRRRAEEALVHARQLRELFAEMDAQVAQLERRFSAAPAASSSATKPLSLIHI